MRKLMCTVLASLALVLTPGFASAVDNCAFVDANDNGVFDGGDTIVTNAQYLGGVPFVTALPFVVPVGCDNVLAAGPAITNGVNVRASKITFLAQLDYLPPGGKGIVFIATGDLIVGNGLSQARISAGGFNALPANSIALHRKSVGLQGGGECKFNFSQVLGNRPIQDTGVGILCGGDLSFVATTVLGSAVNIQSLTGEIDASGQNGSGPGLLSLVALCDNPVTNLTGNGNNNGIPDAADFPCDITLNLGVVSFADVPSLQAVCAPFSIITNVNRFHAFNDPLVMIAGAGAGNPLNVDGASIVGRYRVTLAAEDSALLTQNATIDHGEQLGLSPAPGGARIWLFADPASITRLPVDREDFTGPSAGQTNINNACYRSPNNVNVGQDAGGNVNLLGVPQPAPCKQVGQFTGVLNGNF